jgi:hypothetical protein
MRVSIAHRVGTRTFFALLCMVLLAQIGLVPMAAQAQAQPAWLVGINNLRASAGLAAVPENAASSLGAQHHSTYVTLNGLVHAEDPSKPGYTADGDAAGQSGDVGGGTPTPDEMLRNFMTGAYHWEGILDEGLTSVGYGTASGGQYGGAYTLVLTRSYNVPSKAIMWPASGGTMPYTSYTGGEGPNPLASCAGYAPSTGASLSLQLPAAPQVSSVSLTQAGVSGPLASCSFTGSTVKFDDQAWASLGTSILTYPNAVVIFPKQPLANGTYCASVTNNGTPINWSFTVGGSPTTPPAPCGSGSAATATPVPAAPTATPAPSGTGQLVAGQQLNVGDQLFSANGKTRLILQTDGNLCLYRDNGAYLWCSGTYGKPITHVLMQSDGNFVAYTANNASAPWSTYTSGHPGAKLVLRDDGDLVVLDQNGSILWHSNTAWNTAAPAATPTPAATAVPTATPAASGAARLNTNQQLGVGQQLMSSNGKARLVMQPDGNLVLYRTSDGRALWASGTSGKPMTLALMQTDGNFVGYNNGKTAGYWASGTNPHSNASVVLRDDGNLQVVDQNGVQLWASNTTVP